MPDHTDRILVVEDDEDIRGALATMLESRGYTVVEAENGRVALRRLRGEENFCMILLDLFMPDMNGWAFRDEQTKDPDLASIPVLVITADSAAAHTIAGPGIVGAMTKPVEFDRLLHVIGQYC